MRKLNSTLCMAMTLGRTEVVLRHGPIAKVVYLLWERINGLDLVRFGRGVGHVKPKLARVHRGSSRPGRIRRGVV